MRRVIVGGHCNGDQLMTIRLGSLVNKIYNEPNKFRAGLAAPESNNDSGYIHRVTHASLCQSAKGSERDPEREKKPTVGKTQAGWLSRKGPDRQS